jgi:8-oxo-dGTP pyrophosphatase MutT (NUDIX family)
MSHTDMHGRAVATIGQTFDVLAFGRFAASRTEIVSDPTPRPTCDELESLIEAEWTRRRAEAERRGLMLFNGDLYRYLRHDVRSASTGDNKDARTVGMDDALTLTVGPGCYRDFVGTNLYNHHRMTEFGWESFANPVGTTATLTTADGWIVYGRRSDKVAYHASHVHTFGGSLEVADRGDDGHIDAFGSVRRELEEELGLAADEVSDLHAVGIVRDTEIVQPELLFEGSVALSFDELVNRWRKAESMAEHVELVRLADDADAIVPFIRTCGPIAPVAVAALLLFGRSRFGRPWFDAALRERLD